MFGVVSDECTISRDDSVVVFGRDVVVISAVLSETCCCVDECISDVLDCVVVEVVDDDGSDSVEVEISASIVFPVKTAVEVPSGVCVLVWSSKLVDVNDIDSSVV